MPFCQSCGTKYNDGAKFCQNCGANLPATTASPQAPVSQTPATIETVMCAYHPTTTAVGSCSRCDNPVCSICLLTRGQFLSGSSQICRLCIRLESASNTAAVVGVFLALGGLVLGAIMFSGIVMLFGLVVGFLVWLLLRSHLRGRAETNVRGRSQTGM